MATTIQPLGLIDNPMVASIIGGFLTFLIQVVADKPWWTAATRRWVAIGLAATVSLAVWYAGAYPANWKLFVAQMSAALAAAQVAFTILKSVKLPDGNSVVDWLGMVTPGGEPYEPKR